MKTSDFFYSLPPELIAQQPAPDRTQARMMCIQRASGACEHHQVAELPALLRSGDLLVVNDTRVIPARLYGRKVATGGSVEILLVEETEPDVWEALLRASRPKPGLLLELAEGQVQAEVLAVSASGGLASAKRSGLRRAQSSREAGSANGGKGEGRVNLRLQHERPLSEIIASDGTVPLPPYIKRTPSDTGAQALDRERYQTVYARNPGAVAAPTAGLHFTKELLAELARRGVRHTALTLHVGPGTFQPVRAPEVEQHQMDAERYVVPEVTARLIRETRANQGRIVAVGSTVVRALETVAAEHGSVRAASGRSSLFIYPPYPFRVVDALLTNFHLPESSLLMMVSAFAGYELIRRAYQEAIRQRYRFYSYGDCMLIL